MEHLKRAISKCSIPKSKLKPNLLKLYLQLKEGRKKSVLVVGMGKILYNENVDRKKGYYYYYSKVVLGQRHFHIEISFSLHSFLTPP